MAHDELAAHAAELLSAAGPVRRRRMFGGHGLYVDDLFVAIVAFDRLYLKADAETEAAFAAAGGERFTYEAKGRTAALNYWTPPAEALDSPAEMLPWVRRAQGAALRARAATPVPARRRRSNRTRDSA